MGTVKYYKITAYKEEIRKTHVVKRVIKYEEYCSSKFDVIEAKDKMEFAWALERLRMSSRDKKHTRLVYKIQELKRRDVCSYFAIPYAYKSGSTIEYTIENIAAYNLKIKLNMYLLENFDDYWENIEM